jgi:hypothetical protein
LAAGSTTATHQTHTNSEPIISNVSSTAKNPH